MDEELAQLQRRVHTAVTEQLVLIYRKGKRDKKKRTSLDKLYLNIYDQRHIILREIDSIFNHVAIKDSSKLKEVLKSYL